MGIFDRTSDMGFDCEDQEDGSRICKRYKNKKGGRRLATGTDFELIPDPQTCKVRISGIVNDDDREAVEKQARDMETKCKKGF